MTQHQEFKFVFENISEKLIEKTKQLLVKHNNEIITVAKILGYDTSSYESLMIAGRLLIFNLRMRCGSFSDSVDDLKDRFQEKYYNYIQSNMDVLQSEIDKNISSDYDHDFFSASTFIDTYAAKINFEDTEPVEVPQYTYMRVAIQLYSHVNLEAVLNCYNELSSKYYTPASPIIFNSCFKKNFLSSCFLASIEDNLEDIEYKAGTVVGMISKGCGATGIDISRLRHSGIAGGGYSKGILSWIQIINTNIRAVDQLGKRAGAAVVSLRPHHIDVEAFIQATSKVGDRYNTVHDINTSIFYSYIFMERVRAKAKWTLFCPNHTKNLNDIWGQEFKEEYIKTEILAEEREKEYEEVQKEYNKIQFDLTDRHKLRQAKKVLNLAKSRRIKHKIINAYDLFKMICDSQMKTAMPYLNNGDAINFKCNQNNLGMIRCTNLCQEVTLISDEKNISSCNLHSMSLRHYAKKEIDRKLDITTAITDSFDFQLYADKTMSIVENIDNAIDVAKYPLDKYDENDNLIHKDIINKTNEDNRPIGIGSQGFAEMLYELDLRIEEDKDYVTQLNKTIFACRYFNGMAKSVILAILKGKYKNFESSELSKGNFQFDLWNAELKIKGFSKNRPNFTEPINPKNWNQKEILLSNGDTIKDTWEDLRRCVMKYGVRNSMLFCEMPTASSSIILRNTETSEIGQSNIYSRRILNGSFPVLNRYMVNDLQKINLWNQNTVDFLIANDGSIKNLDVYINSHSDKYPEFSNATESKDVERLLFLIQKYKTMWEVSQKQMLKYSKDRAEYVCNSISQNIYMKDPAFDKIGASHLTADELGLKNIIYYLRTGTSIKTIKFAMDAEVDKQVQKTVLNGQDEVNGRYVELSKNKNRVNEVDDSNKKNEKNIPINLYAGLDVIDENTVCTMTEGCLSCGS
jgi:ribonucleoside-diphosphate reductase alpha chain